MVISLTQETLPFGYDLERIIDDWVLIGFLVGNDFVPNLPSMLINHVSFVHLEITFYPRVLLYNHWYLVARIIFLSCICTVVIHFDAI